MTIDRTKIGWLLIAWAFFQGLIGFGINIPTLLMILGTVFYLI